MGFFLFKKKFWGHDLRLFNLLKDKFKDCKYIHRNESL